MRIRKIIYQNRRDFRAEYECEGCGAIYESRGYDDDNFHRNVVPTLECIKCGKSAVDLGSDYRPLQPKYPEGFQI